MKINLHISIVAVAASLLSNSISAQETGSFLRNPADAVSMSLGGASVVSVENASVFNTAAFVPFSGKTFSANVSALSWMKGLYDSGLSTCTLSAHYNFDKYGTVFIGGRYFQSPSFEVADDDGYILEDSAEPTDIAVELGYAYPFLKDFSAFVTGRYLRLNPGYGDIANAVCFDAGVGYHHEFGSVLSDVSAMLQAKNFGTSPDYGSGSRSLPWLANAGVSAGLDLGKCNYLRAGVSADVSLRPSEMKGVSTSFGLEYSYRKIAYLRGGYHLGNSSVGEPDWASCGLGVSFWHLRIDGAYIIASSSSPLHGTAAFTLTFYF